jgi:DNA-binding NtrC family response regulator
VAHDGSRIEVLPLNGTGAYHLRHLLTLALRRARLFAPRVLVVDDEPAIRDLLIRALGSAGLRCGCPGWGSRLAAAEGAKPPCDLVVTNSYMPNLTGEQLIWSPTGDVPRRPILHLDNLAHPLGPHARSVPTLYKPFSMDALLEAIALTLSEQPLAGRLRARMSCRNTQQP